jgi:hypothetical protein
MEISIRKFAGEVDRFLRYYMYILPELHFSGYIQAADSGFLTDSGWFGDGNPNPNNPRLSQVGKIVKLLKQIMNRWLDMLEQCYLYCRYL